MQLYAMSTGNFWSGALIMGFFALGTTPGLLGIGGLTSVIKGGSAKKFFKFAGVVVAILALLNISNGLNLTGIKGKLVSSAPSKTSDQSPKDDPSVKIENGIQVIRMDQVGAGYKPNSFTIKKGIPSKWIITSKSQSCAASIYSKKLGIQQNLDPGENIIEFTPKEVGKIPFSCSMGMYTGSFNVVENNSPAPEKPTSENTAPTQKDISAQTSAPAPSKVTEESKDVQIIKTSYTYKDDIKPDRFTVKVDRPVQFEVLAQEDGQGCMSSITIPDLTKDFYYLEKGKTFTFKFTPQKKGSFYITCAMGSPRGTITVE
jgi:plastocyanin domain-containing protein